MNERGRSGALRFCGVAGAWAWGAGVSVSVGVGVYDPMMRLVVGLGVVLMLVACGSSGTGKDGGTEGGGPECFYANRCVEKCGGPVVKSGCDVVCAPPLIEVLECSRDSGSDAPNDAPQDAAKDAPSD